MQAKVGQMMLPDDATDWAKTGSIVAVLRLQRLAQPTSPTFPKCQ